MYNVNSGAYLFRLAMLGLTFGPLVIAVFISQGLLVPGLQQGFAGLFFLGAAHVPATLYLLCDHGIRDLLFGHPVKLIAIPVVLFGTSTTILTFASLDSVLLFMLVYVAYGAWHFGRQNIGVLAVSCMSSATGPIHQRTRNIINLGVISGVLGVFSTLPPKYGLDPDLFGFSQGKFELFFAVTYLVGLSLLMITAGLFLIDVLYRRRQMGVLNATIYLGSALFFLPIFCGNNPLITVSSYTTSHGLQYVAFLAFLAFSKSRYEAGHQTIWPLITFTVIMALAVSITLYPSMLAFVSRPITEFIAGYSLSESQFLRSVFGGSVGITLMHYWIDQSVWRLRDPERRSWFRTQYALILPQTELKTTKSSIHHGTLLKYRCGHA